MTRTGRTAAAIAALAASLAFTAPGTLSAQTAADSAAIRGAALDYIEGWFAGDAARMERALHPELVKRILVADPETGERYIDGMGTSKLVAGTRGGYGRQIPEADRKTEVTIFHVLGDAATAMVDAGPWVDYMHLVKVGGEWKILNVLWEQR